MLHLLIPFEAEGVSGETYMAVELTGQMVSTLEARRAMFAHIKNWDSDVLNINFVDDSTQWGVFKIDDDQVVHDVLNSRQACEFSREVMVVADGGWTFDASCIETRSVYMHVGSHGVWWEMYPSNLEGQSCCVTSTGVSWDVLERLYPLTYHRTDSGEVANLPRK